MHGIFLLYRELNGEFLKKTYCTEMPDGRWHLVVYTLMEWEMVGQCCQHFVDTGKIFGSRPKHSNFPKSALFCQRKIDLKQYAQPEGREAEALSCGSGHSESKKMFAMDFAKLPPTAAPENYACAEFYSKEAESACASDVKAELLLDREHTAVGLTGSEYCMKFSTGEGQELASKFLGTQASVDRIFGNQNLNIFEDFVKRRMKDGKESRIRADNPGEGSRRSSRHNENLWEYLYADRKVSSCKQLERALGSPFMGFSPGKEHPMPEHEVERAEKGQSALPESI